MGTEPVSVECYAGHTYPTAPRAFVFRGRRRSVEQVIRTWRTPGAVWFRVRVEHDDVFTLVYYEDEYAWIILSTDVTEEDR